MEEQVIDRKLTYSDKLICLMGLSVLSKALMRINTLENWRRLTPEFTKQEAEKVKRILATDLYFLTVLRERLKKKISDEFSVARLSVSEMLSACLSSDETKEIIKDIRDYESKIHNLDYFPVLQRRDINKLLDKVILKITEKL